MQYAYLKFDNTTLPSMTEYHSLEVKEPTVVKIAGANGAAIKLSTYTSCWISEEDYFKLERFSKTLYNKESIKEENPKAQVSEDFILKMLAIGKDTSLAIPLLKKD